MTGASIQQHTLGSSGAAIMLGAAATISLGNVWRLPIMTGEAGGLIFFGSYVIALLLMAWPLLTAELLVGRLSGRDPSGAFFWITTKGKIAPVWRWGGVPALWVSILVAAFVAIFLGWTLAAAGLALRGIPDPDVGATVAGLAAVTRQLPWTLGLALIGLLSTGAVIALTSVNAVRQAARWSITVVFLVAAGLLAYAVHQHGEAASVDTLIRTATHIGIGRPFWLPVLEGVREAFFTLSLGTGVMIVLGSLLPENARPVRVAGGILVLDFLFTLLAGLALVLLRVGTLESELAEPVSGLVVLFERLPARLGDLPSGRALLAAWYMALAVIGWFSLLLLLMPGVAWFRRVLSLSDVLSVLAVLGLVALVVALLAVSLTAGVPVEAAAEGSADAAGSVSPWSLAPVWGVAQWLCVALIVPVNGLLLCLFVSRMMPPTLLRRGWGRKQGVGYLLWTTVMRYPVRVLLILMCLFTTGVIQNLLTLWLGAPG